jgi:hypothetical protein
MVRICMCEHHERVFYSKEYVDPYEVYVMDCSKVGEKGWECLVIEYEQA